MGGHFGEHQGQNQHPNSSSKGGMSATQTALSCFAVGDNSWISQSSPSVPRVPSVVWRALGRKTGSSQATANANARVAVPGRT